ncbi:MAG: NAD(P)H-hydrate dehydratase [Candidatus Gastranaerophilales bacterium]|nr:NAD(P)H-hydrate dehydratase [Candidatus Gastranaerophilales bacterium]
MSEEIFTQKEFVKELLPKRQPNSHKGTYGAVLNIAGSVNYSGAAFLSSIAALKIGAGYVTAACCKTVANSLRAVSPDIVLLPLEEKDGCIAVCEYRKILEILPKYTAVSIGCGLSSMLYRQNNIEKFMENFLAEIKDITTPIVIDADGLNIIAKLNITNLPQNTVLTPHTKELSRLLNVNTDEITADRTKYAKIAAKKYNAVVVLKGSQSVIIDGEKVFINPTGNSALSKAGAGDVLTGIIAGLLAQGLSPFNSAVCGVYIHGLTGEAASLELSEYSTNASDLLTFLPKVVKNLL